MDWIEERKAALAKGLGIEADDVDYKGDDTYETPEGTYLVFDAEEAEEAAREDIQNTIDDMGLDAFSEDFQDFILSNLIDEDAIKEDIYQYKLSYANDIETESSDDFENRLIEEMYDNGILTDDDFEKDEDGEVDYRVLKDDVDLDEKKEEFAQQLADDATVEDFLSEFDSNFVRDYLTENNYINWDDVIDVCIRDDGIAHFIASYDGEELELEGDLYAYRID